MRAISVSARRIGDDGLLDAHPLLTASALAEARQELVTPASEYTFFA